ncbi:MAG: Large-conductance mechanosensitive channel [uncultured Acidimicrobiales bacterium]|uniref:Large-conductance mechanosensitive channel n=1 Tax=uncultured Acidimicrobiales bacterium TaxID=310071 RepID=A0A6J4IM38_9ACTN|nr:MAG: Large-conductance mechanosensitive channel [uncultured Acidimicrobiales bacterium]
MAAVIFFFVVKPVTALMNRRKTEPEVASTTKDCPQCLSSVPFAARRCAFCTSELAAG